MCVSGWFGCVSEKARMGPHYRRRSEAFRLSRIQHTSLTWDFAKTPLAIRIIVLALGPWTPSFWAPSWRFLPIQARQSAMRPHCGVFCRPLLPGAFAGTSDWVSAERFSEGLWSGFDSGHFCEGLLQGILWSLSHDLLRRLAIDVPQRNLVFAFELGYRSATKTSRLRLGQGIVPQRKSRACVWGRASSRNDPRVCGSADSHPVPNDGVSRSRPRRSAVSGVE